MQLSLKVLKALIFEAQKDVKPLSKINQRAQNKGKEALFSDETLGLIASLPETELSRLENRKGFIKWLANVVEGASHHPSTQDIRYIVDFVVGSADAKIEAYKTFDDAYKASQEWHETLSQDMDQDVEHRDDAQVIHDFKNGYKIVDLQQCDLDAEGNAMGHCVGGYDLSQGKKIYSLRDARNKPHATIEIEDSKVEQIKGKQNEPPIEKYAKMIRGWLKTTSLNYETLDYVFIATSEELASFAKSKDVYTRIAVAKNENTPEDVLRILAKDRAWDVRGAIADNENTSEGVLRILAKDKNTDVCASTAINKNTPQDVLRILSKDKRNYIRMCVAVNENVPEDVLRDLSKDERVEVRSYVARNKYAPPDILKILAKDNDTEVCGAVAGNENTPQDVLVDLAKHQIPLVRASAAGNKNLPQSILIALSKDENWMVRSSVTQNKNTTQDTLRALSKDENNYIRMNAIKRLEKFNI